MENSHAVRLIVLVVGVSLLFSSAKAFNKTDPTTNPNLAPFEKMLSAYWCLKNTSSVCRGSFALNESGWLNINPGDTKVFCEQGGCVDHTRAVLACLWYVKDDYRFQNNATIYDLKQTINIGCTQGFTGKSLNMGSGSGKTRMYYGITTFSALAFVSLFYM